MQRCRVTSPPITTTVPCGSRLYVADSAQAEKLIRKGIKSKPQGKSYDFDKEIHLFSFLCGRDGKRVVNLLADSKIYWSIIVAAAVNMCVLLSNILFSNRSVPAKIALQLICVIANILAIENLKRQQGGLGLNMAVPFVPFAATLLLALIAQSTILGVVRPQISSFCVLFVSVLYPSSFISDLLRFFGPV